MSEFSDIFASPGCGGRLGPGGRFLQAPHQPSDELLRGAHGHILLANDQRNNNALVAIKFYEDKSKRDHAAEVLRNFMHDGGTYVATFADASEDGAACVFDVPQYAAPYAIVMKAGKGTLQAWLETPGDLTPAKCVPYIQEIVHAVRYMHRKGWAHCDLKPANIVAFGTGVKVLKLVDFDSTRRFNGKLEAMTPEVCPPEAAKMLRDGKPVTAKPELDVWALGCILFHMIKKETLVTALLGEEAAGSGDGVWSKLADVMQADVNAVLAGLQKGDELHKNAHNLLSKMLQVTPNDRITVEAIAQHALLRGVLAQTCDTVGSGVRAIMKTQVQHTEAIREVKDLVIIGHTLMKELAEYQCPRTFVILPDIVSKKQLDGAEEGVMHDWVHEVCTWFDKDLTQEARQGPGKPSGGIISELVSRFTRTKFRLYLVCELSGERVGDGYVVTKPKDFVAKLMPAMQVSFKLLSLANSASKIARCMWPMTPAIPQSTMASAQHALDNLAKRSSAEEYGCVQLALDLGADGSMQTQVGASIRELRAFLREADPNCVWAGLQRDFDDRGHVRWVSKSAKEAQGQGQQQGQGQGQGQEPEADQGADDDAQEEAEEAPQGKLQPEQRQQAPPPLARPPITKTPQNTPPQPQAQPARDDGPDGRMECGLCRGRVLPVRTHETGACTWLTCLCLMGTPPFAYIPFCTNCTKDVVYRCPHCSSQLHIVPVLDC